MVEIPCPSLVSANVYGSEINLLHEIVLRAQTRDNAHSRPKKALFDAYEEVFAEHGQATHHDRACLRILLQLAGPGLSGATLAEKFGRLLAQHHITLFYGSEDGSDVSDSREDDVLVTDNKYSMARNAPLGAAARTRQLERRNSFTSMYDITAEVERRTKRRQLSRTSASALLGDVSPLKHPNTRKPSFNGESGPGPGPIAGWLDSAPKQQDLQNDGLMHNDVEDDNSDLGSLPLFTNGGDDSLLHRADELLRRYAPNPGHGEGPLTQMLGSDQGPGSRLPLGAQPFDHPLTSLPPSNPLRDNDTFNDERVRLFTSRRIFNKWLRRTRIRVAKVHALESRARDRDALTLYRLVFKLWQKAANEIQKERREAVMVLRATKAYDHLLKLKAFLHWYAVAMEAQAMTSAARRRYLHVKYFHAWQQLTVRHETDIRKQNIKASFHLLRSRAAQYYNDEVTALELYHANLTKLIFWRWVLAYAEEKASTLRARRLKRRHFQLWGAKLHYQANQMLSVEASSHRMRIQHFLHRWATKARIDVAGYRQADAFRQESLSKKFFGFWKTASQLSPLERRVGRMQDWRVARSTFGMWLLRTRIASRADVVNLQRIKQNALTAWNDRLRGNAVVMRINNRLVAQVLYKWVIAQRSMLFTRICEETRKRQSLRRLLGNFRARRDRLSMLEKEFSNARDVKVSAAILQSCKVALTVRKARSQMAMEFYRP